MTKSMLYKEPEPVSKLTFKQQRKEKRKAFAQKTADVAAAKEAARIVVEGLERTRVPTWCAPRPLPRCPARLRPCPLSSPPPSAPWTRAC